MLHYDHRPTAYLGDLIKPIGSTARNRHFNQEANGSSISSIREEGMPHHLSYKFDRAEPQKIRKQLFPTMEGAFAEACAVMAAKKGWDFEISNESGETVMDDPEIQSACKEAQLVKNAK